MSDVNVFVSAIEELVAEHKECVAAIETASKRKLEIELRLSTASEALSKVVFDGTGADGRRQPSSARSEAMKRAWAARRSAAAAGDGATAAE